VKRIPIPLLVIVFVLASATALLAKPDNGRPPPDRGSQTFTITGDVTGLVPFVEGTIEVLVTNDQRFEIVVDSLDIAIGDASRDCGAEHLGVDAPLLPVSVPERGQTTVSVGARLAPDAPDACQGQTWPLTYSGTATRP
jgi:hypothetical protein